MKYAIMCYDAGRKNFNIGDYIQSLAARQFLPRCDTYINREELSLYSGEPVKLIMNGWFMCKPQNWPPAPAIDPLIVAFHIRDQRADQLAAGAGKEFLLAHAPVGCRDRHTCAELEERGIPAHYTSCLTLTLGNTYKADGASGKIYFVDVLCKEPRWRKAFSNWRMFKSVYRRGVLFHPFRRKRILSKLLNHPDFARAEELTQHFACADFPTQKERFEFAAKRLEEFSHARLVVTSRIHCALPCLAMGVPVIFVNGGFADDDAQGRVGSFFDLFNTISIDEKGKVKTNFDPATILTDAFKNPTHHLPFAEELTRRCKEFINS